MTRVVNTTGATGGAESSCLFLFFLYFCLLFYFAFLFVCLIYLFCWILFYVCLFFCFGGGGGGGGGGGVGFLLLNLCKSLLVFFSFGHCMVLSVFLDLRFHLVNFKLF